MYPYIILGPIHLGTFGILLWLGAVAATWVLHRNFVRYNVDADALNVVAIVVVGGILGAKTWHELQDLHELHIAMRQVTAPGWGHPLDILLGLLHWFQAGFAWFGGLVAGIALLYVSGHLARFKNGARLGGIRMLDLAAPAAAIGYGVGRIGCLLSGDGDYGVNTTRPWGVHMMNGADEWHRALVLPTPATAAVQPTPIYELLFSLLVFWIIWQLGKRSKPVGWMTGLYLVLSGIGRFLVEYIRVNPKLYFGNTMSNAQVAALGSILAGAIVMIIAFGKNAPWEQQRTAEEAV